MVSLSQISARRKQQTLLRREWCTIFYLIWSSLFTSQRILANSYGCTRLAGGRAPNFVLLDWVNIGEATKAANKLNGFA